MFKPPSLKQILWRKVAWFVYFKLQPINDWRNPFNDDVTKQHIVIINLHMRRLKAHTLRMYKEKAKLL